MSKSNHPSEGEYQDCQNVEEYIQFIHMCTLLGASMLTTFQLPGCGEASALAASEVLGLVIIAGLIIIRQRESTT